MRQNQHRLVKEQASVDWVEKQREKPKLEEAEKRIREM